MQRLFEGGHYNAQPWDCVALIRGPLLNGVRRLFEEIRYIKNTNKFENKQSRREDDQYT